MRKKPQDLRKTGTTANYTMIIGQDTIAGNGQGAISGAGPSVTFS